MYSLEKALVLFGKKINHCANCGKELKYKYKPKEGWNIEGFLCGDCHIEKTKEFVLKEQEEKANLSEFCAICKRELDEDKKRKPKWQWNLEIESDSYVCEKCYEKADADYNKKLNFCAICNRKLGFIRYNTKPAWNLKGQLCRSCWDRKNEKKEI